MSNLVLCCLESQKCGIFLVFDNFIAEGRLRFGISIIAEVPLSFNLFKKLIVDIALHFRNQKIWITHIQIFWCIQIGIYPPQ